MSAGALLDVLFRLEAGRGHLGQLPVLRLEREIWGKPRTVLLFVSERLRQGKIRGLMQHVKKAIRALERWKTQLAKPRSGPRTLEAAQRQIQAILSGQHVSRVLKVEGTSKNWICCLQ
jgi:hypothetical protein